MRIPGWFLGLFGFLGLIVMTGVCAFVAYGGVRSQVIQAWDRGLRVDSPAEIVQALINPSEFSMPTRPALSATATITPISLLPSPTPPAGAFAVTEQPSPTVPTGATATLDPLAQYRWDDPRQIRILLLGIDERRGFDTERAYRTDTIILLNIDPVRRIAGLISFPRDLWVSIPNFSQERINTANFIGDNVNYPGGGGPRLLMDTIAANFGVKVDRYVRINFTVFERVAEVIAPDGVEICVRETIDDPTYPDAGYGTIRVTFQPGCQKLDPTRLLQYARTRKTQGGDFDRARRQQEVLDALRAQVLSAGGVVNFFSQIPTLWNELADSYDTNMALDELIRLGFLMGEIPPENIQFKVIDQNYIASFGKAPDGSDVLIPNTGAITALIQSVLYPRPEVTQGDLFARAQAENQPIRVFNGTDIAGLASRVQEWLVGRGVRVEGVGNAPAHGGQPTLIKNYGTGRWTAEYLADLMGLPPDRIVPGTDGLATNGVVIVVGPDVQALLGALMPDASRRAARPGGDACR
jgi:LCP family protein required for cell wall assembly